MAATAQFYDKLLAVSVRKAANASPSKADAIITETFKSYLDDWAPLKSDGPREAKPAISVRRFLSERHMSPFLALWNKQSASLGSTTINLGGVRTLPWFDC